MQPPVEISVSMKPTVFYDGSCPLCGREIAHYRRLRGSNNLLWVDISSNEVALMAYGLDKERAMARFHVMDAHGTWHTGAFAFAELWSQLLGYRWLALIVMKLRLLNFMDKVYSRFAAWRPGKSCQDGHCQPHRHDKL